MSAHNGITAAAIAAWTAATRVSTFTVSRRPPGSGASTCAAARIPARNEATIGASATATRINTGGARWASNVVVSRHCPSPGSTLAELTSIVAANSPTSRA